MLTYKLKKKLKKHLKNSKHYIPCLQTNFMAKIQKEKTSTVQLRVCPCLQSSTRRFWRLASWSGREVMTFSDRDRVTRLVKQPTSGGRVASLRRKEVNRNFGSFRQPCFLSNALWYRYGMNYQLCCGAATFLGGSGSLRFRSRLRTTAFITDNLYWIRFSLPKKLLNSV